MLILFLFLLHHNLFFENITSLVYRNCIDIIMLAYEMLRFIENIFNISKVKNDLQSYNYIIIKPKTTTKLQFNNLNYVVSL